MFELADKAQSGASGVAAGLIVFIVVGIIAFILMIAATHKRKP